MLDQAGNTSQVDRTVGIDTRPPSLDVSFNGTNGQNGWYLSAGVSAATSDPLPGSGSSELQYSLNSGAWTTFSGSYTFPDGTNTVDFRAVDLAENTTQATAPITTKVDSTDPVIDTNITGTPGKNGWYISTASVTASAVDATSGMNIFESNIDSGGWNTYTSAHTVNDGSHIVSFYAEDLAGQSAQTDLTVQVDTNAPQIGGAITAGTPGQNGWYTSTVTLNGAAFDPTPGSGLAVFTASVDGGAPADGSAAIGLTDGQHTVIFDAEDTAGLTASLTRTINVDSVAPTLTVDTSLPVWNRGSVSFTGTAADALSGLARVEISTDNGLTWRSTTGTDTWTVDWDTTTAADGDRVVRIRSVDTAGLTTESAFYVGVDNHGPQISAPASWSVDDTVTLAVTDTGSGVDEVVVKIIDPLNRYPTRVLQYEGGVFPLAFTWDRHFEDGTLAPHGEYTVLITAADNFGNESVLNAKVSVPLIGHIFGGYNTATPMPTLLPTLTPTPRGLAPTLAPTSTLAATELAFGVPVTGAGGSGPSAPASPAQHSSPPSLGFTCFIQDVFFPTSGSTVVETTTTSPAAQPLSAAATGVLFGSAAVSATTGLAAYYLQKKKEEEEARREAILAKIAAEKKAAEKQREAIFERNSQQAAANLKAKLKEMELLGVSDDTIKEVKRRYTEIGYKSAESLANAAIKIETTVIPYTREKADPVLENYTGKPSMSMSDALKITNPQPEPVAVENVTKRTDVCYVPDKKRTDVCYGPTIPLKEQESNWWDKFPKFLSDIVDTGYEGDRNHPKEVFTYSPGGYSPSMSDRITVAVYENTLTSSSGVTDMDKHDGIVAVHDMVTSPKDVLKYINQRNIENGKSTASGHKFSSLMEDATMTSGYDAKVPKYQPNELVAKLDPALEGGSTKFWSTADSEAVSKGIDSVSGVIGTTSFVLQATGEMTGNQDIQDLGEYGGVAADVIDAGRTIVTPEYMILEASKGIFGKAMLGYQVYAGSMQLKTNYLRLTGDPTIDPRYSNDNVWNRRTGVALLAIGGACLAIGALGALFAAALPLVAVLLVGGTALSVVGWAMGKWG